MRDIFPHVLVAYQLSILGHSIGMDMVAYKPHGQVRQRKEKEDGESNKLHRNNLP
jgi:hypothetical protein